MIHMKFPDKGYRRINDDLRHDEHIHVTGPGALNLPSNTAAMAVHGVRRILST